MPDAPREVAQAYRAGEGRTLELRRRGFLARSGTRPTPGACLMTTTDLRTDPRSGLTSTGPAPTGAR